MYFSFISLLFLIAIHNCFALRPINPNTCPEKFTNQGYRCCSQCNIVYLTDEIGNWSVENGKWCGCIDRLTKTLKTNIPKTICPINIIKQGYECCSEGCQVLYTDKDGDWSLEKSEWCGCGASSITVSKTETGSFNDKTYNFWSDDSSNSVAVIKADGSFKVKFDKTADIYCGVGMNFNSAKTNQDIGHIYAKFNLTEHQVSEEAQFEYYGVFGWNQNLSKVPFPRNTKNAIEEFYILDYMKGELPNSKLVSEVDYETIGHYNVDGSNYTVYRISFPDGGYTITSVREEMRASGTIDFMAHYKHWEKLGLTLFKITEIEVMGLVGTLNDDDEKKIKGSFDFSSIEFLSVKSDNSIANSEICDHPPPEHTGDFMVIDNASQEVKTSNEEDRYYYLDNYNQRGDVNMKVYSDGSFTYYNDVGGEFKTYHKYNHTTEEMDHLIAEYKMDLQVVNDKTEEFNECTFYYFSSIYVRTEYHYTEDSDSYHIVNSYSENFIETIMKNNNYIIRKLKSYTVDGVGYTVYSLYTKFRYIYLSVRDESLPYCSSDDIITVDITAHLKAWENLANFTNDIIILEVGFSFKTPVMRSSVDYSLAKIYVDNEKEVSEVLYENPQTTITATAAETTTITDTTATTSSN